MTFLEKYERRVESIKSLVCVGLDSDFAKLPSSVKDTPDPQFAFNTAMIDATAEYTAAYKPNLAFYEARGDQGLHELKLTLDYLRDRYPEIVTICDAKRADIGHTNTGYVEEIFDWLGFDAITLHPYLGKEALQPFLERTDKGSIILCRTSNPGAPEFQDLMIDGKPLWQIVATRVAEDWNAHGNCLVVVGATYPEEMAALRKLTGDMTFLVPGIGAQGGDLKAALAAGLNRQKKGMIINSSRGIIFASRGEDFAEAAGREAKKLRDAIEAVRSEN